MDTESDTVSSGVVGGLLERAARAVPAAVEENRHGWWLRHTDSSMWWSGAVLAHGPGEPMTLDAGVGTAEEFYVGHDAPARFQICAHCPPGLDSTLSYRGYQLECPMSLQIAAADDIASRFSAPRFSASRLQVRLTDHLGPAWFTAWRAVSATPAHRASEWRSLHRVRSPSVYVTVVDRDRPIAVGRAVADSGWTGVFDMATAPHARGRGAAKVVLAAIAGWAQDEQAPRVYLQAEPDNAAARRLYEAACFAEIERYHYRVGAPRGPRMRVSEPNSTLRVPVAPGDLAPEREGRVPGRGCKRSRPSQSDTRVGRDVGGAGQRRHDVARSRR